MQDSSTSLQSNLNSAENISAQSNPSGFKKWAPLLVLSLALMIIIIDTTILNVSLRTIINDLHTDIISIQWVITAYSLILAAFTITGGRLGDLFGRKKMFVLGAVIFAIGSFLASISKSVSVLIAGEAIIEGIGAVLMMPATASLLVSNYKGRDRAVAFGVWGGIAGAASAIGPILGGWLTSNYSWRWAFRINVGVALVLLLGSIIIKEARDKEEKPTLDLVGVLLSSLGLLSIVYGFIKAETYGWLKAKETFTLFGHALKLGNLSIVPVFIILGLSFLGLFLLWERHMDRQNKTPLVSLNLFKNRQFVSGATTTGILALGQSGLIFSIPIFLQGVKNLDAFHTGLYMLPLSLTALVMAPFSALLIKILPPKRLVQIGLAVNVLAFLVLRWTLRVDATAWTLAPGFILFGLGMGLIMAQVSNITLSAVSVEEAGEASGVNNTLRQVGATLGSAIMGAILISTLTANLSNGVAQSSAIPASAKAQISQSFSENASRIEFGNASNFEGNIPQFIKNELTKIVQTGTTDANKTTLGFGALFVMLGFITSFALPAGKEVETEQSVAHKTYEQIQEEKIRRFKYQAVVLTALAVIAAGIGGYAIAKHKFQNAGTPSVPAADISAQPPLSATPTLPTSGNPSVNTQSAASSSAGASQPKGVSPDEPKAYSNASWHFGFMAPSGWDVADKAISADTLSLYDVKNGKQYGTVQKYDNMENVDLNAIETQLRGSPDISGLSRITFAGLPAIEFQVKNSGEAIAVINNGSLYYISGSLVSPPIAATFKFI
jgi:EmrB/QacA subfamily drug resistance transporter